MKNLLVLGSLLLVSCLSTASQAQASPTIAGNYIIQSDDNANEGCNINNNYINGIVGSHVVIEADDQHVVFNVVVDAKNSSLPATDVPYGTVAPLEEFMLGVVTRTTIEKFTLNWDGVYNADKSVFTYTHTMTPDPQKNGGFTLTYTRTATNLIIKIASGVAQENRTCVLTPTN
jgi:hypothetical protein